MTPWEIEKLLVDIESDRAERKESLQNADRIRQTICAFANDLPNHKLPGVLFIGVNDQFGQVTKENFGKPGASDYRNPNLAAVMKELGYVQRFGVGIEIAKNEMHKNGNPPPEFQVEDTHVAVILRKRA